MIDIRTESKGYVAHGVSACAGCGMELIIRNVLDVLGQDMRSREMTIPMWWHLRATGRPWTSGSSPCPV